MQKGARYTGKIGGTLVVRMSCAVVIALSLLSTAQAADICEATVLHDVGATEDATSVLKKGETDTGISQYNVERKTGIANVCSHGGYCFPTSLLIGGKKVETLRLTNCMVGRKLTPFEDGFDTYDLVVDRLKVSPERLEVDDADNRLLHLGLCSACAGNAAHAFVQEPGSRCGRLVAATLRGSKQALAHLRSDRSPCP